MRRQSGHRGQGILTGDVVHRWVGAYEIMEKRRKPERIRMKKKNEGRKRFAEEIPINATSPHSRRRKQKCMSITVGPALKDVEVGKTIIILKRQI